MAMDHAAQITPSVMEVAPVPPPPDQATLDDEAEAVESKIQAMAAMNAELSSLLANVTVRDTPAGLLIDIADEGDRQLLFEPSSSKLKPALQTFLSLLGPMLGRERNQLEINGHTDARPFASGAITSNWDLSFERANQARQILEANGLRPGQVGGVVGRGSSDPHDPKQPYAASNRRLSVLLVRRPSRSAPAKSPATPATEASGSGASVDPDRDTKWPYGSTFLIGK
jgi:chemotaxis protein MotB